MKTGSTHALCCSDCPSKTTPCLTCYIVQDSKKNCQQPLVRGQPNNSDFPFVSFIHSSSLQCLGAYLLIFSIAVFDILYFWRPHGCLMFASYSPLVCLLFASCLPHVSHIIFLPSSKYPWTFLFGFPLC